MNRIGNQYLAHTVDDRAKAESRLYAMPSQSCVIVDNPAWAIDLKRRFPSTLVIHRTTLPNENDKKLHGVMSPAQFIDDNRVFAGTNVLVQVYNEPETYDRAHFQATCKFCTSLYDLNLSQQVGLRFCFLNVGMGHLAEYAPPLLDPLLYRVAGYVQGSVIGVHEYAEHSTKLERPYRIGRFELITNRVRQLGLPPVAPVLGRVLKGAPVEYRAYGPDWIYLHTRDGLRGYVSKQGGKPSDMEAAEPYRLRYLYCGARARARMARCWPARSGGPRRPALPRRGRARFTVASDCVATCSRIGES